MAQRFGRNKRRRLHEEAERMAQELRIAKIEVEIDKRRFAAEYEWRTAQAEEEFLMAQSTERTQLVVMGPHKHCRTGDVYQPLMVANTAASRPGYPATMVYRRERDGTVWSRPLSEWTAKFEPL